MKKIALISVICLLISLSFASCQRCKTCTYTYKNPADGTTVTVDKGEQCGKKSTLENYENETKGEAAKVGGEMTCTDK